MSDLKASVMPSYQGVLNIVYALGNSRSGKGTICGAACEVEGVRTIDQGLKFRILTFLAVSSCIDTENPVAIANFLAHPDTEKNLLEGSIWAAQASKDKVNAYLYQDPGIKNNVSKLALAQESHQLVEEALLQQLAAYREDTEVSAVFVDGRGLENAAIKARKASLGYDILRLFITCDPEVAAQRSLGLVDNGELTEDQLNLIREETSSIARRNRDDTQRKLNPLLDPADEANGIDYVTYEVSMLGSLHEVRDLSPDTTIRIDTTHLNYGEVLALGRELGELASSLVLV